uniref:Uncharacterized protein n=1 Tax=Acrobeloides nanus TaxID=290746 RepID=A0A914DUR3_9BILA
MPGKYKSEELRKLIVEAKQRGEMDKDIAERYHCGTASEKSGRNQKEVQQQKRAFLSVTRRMEPHPGRHPQRIYGVHAEKNEGCDQGERLPD